MDHFRFRGPVKVISYIDMTFSLVIIILTVVASVGVFLATVTTDHQELRLFFLQGNHKKVQDGRKAFGELGRTFTIIWILSFTFNILQFFAGCALLSGTDPASEDEEEDGDSKSIQKCRFWQCTSLFLFIFIVLLVWYYPTPYLISFCLGELVFRAVGIYLVGKYVGELEEGSLNESSAQLYYYDLDDTDEEFPTQQQQAP